MEYRTVFDLATTGYTSWRFAATGLIFVAVATVMLWISVYRPTMFGGAAKRFRIIVASVMLAFALLWTSTSFWATYGDYRELRTAVAQHATSMVEGPVTDFTPMPAEGHQMERFCVAGHCFEYSDYIVVAGFNNTSSHGGPIRAGLPVRVTYVGNSIVKLEVAR